MQTTAKEMIEKVRLSYLSKGPCHLFVEENIIQTFEQDKLRNSEKGFIVCIKHSAEALYKRQCLSVL